VIGDKKETARERRRNERNRLASNDGPLVNRPGPGGRKSTRTILQELLRAFYALCKLHGAAAWVVQGALKVRGS